MFRREAGKWFLGTVALGLAAFAVSDARAGNLSITPVQYFSVSMVPGQYFSYTGTEEDVTLLVDDITYSAQIDPCDLFDRCEFFDTNDLDQTGIFEDDDLTINGPNTTPSPLGGTEQTTTTSQRWAINYVVAKGAYLGAEMTESGTGGPGGTFDKMTHSLYGELAGKFKRNKETLTSYGRLDVFWGGPDPNPVEQYSVAAWKDVAATVSETETIAVSTWAIQTSESRHYQSPQIVQDGNRVNFLLETAVTDYGSYAYGEVFVKGRVYIGTTGAPVESTDVTVTTP